jgi:hypothetical protein
MRNRSRQALRSPEALDTILSRAGESRFARARPPIPERLWREAVGARIAERAQPVWLHDGTLVLRVTSSVWAHELSLLAEDVCARLRECAIDARSLRFRVGPLPAVERPPERRVARTVPTDRFVPPELAASLEQVPDQSLRDAIERAATANLAWQSIVTTTEADSVTEARRAARAPRSAGAETCPQDPKPPASPALPRRTRANEPDRSR